MSWGAKYFSTSLAIVALLHTFNSARRAARSHGLHSLAFSGKQLELDCYTWKERFMERREDATINAIDRHSTHEHMYMLK